MPGMGELVMYLDNIVDELDNQNYGQARKTLKKLRDGIKTDGLWNGVLISQDQLQAYQTIEKQLANDQRK